MILEALAGLVINVFLADNATGQTLSRGMLMYKKIERVEGSKEEVHQLTKDIILGVDTKYDDM
jgi:hypothetical protein